MSDGKQSGNSRGCLAFTVYIALSFLFFFHGLIGHYTYLYVRIGPYSGSFIFSWNGGYQYHQLSPFLTKVVWAPVVRIAYRHHTIRELGVATDCVPRTTRDLQLDDAG
jgi:hypothetical protein